VKVQWSSEAQASALRYMRDQDGMRAIIAAVDALADDPRPPTAFHAGEYHRLRTGPYRIRYVIEGDLITIERVERVL
jgi:mRNA-degrading endonuclease RelE of RelBE toxin-antitoxin system